MTKLEQAINDLSMVASHYRDTIIHIAFAQAKGIPVDRMSTKAYGQIQNMLTQMEEIFRPLSWEDQLVLYEQFYAKWLLYDFLDEMQKTTLKIVA